MTTKFEVMCVNMEDWQTMLDNPDLAFLVKANNEIVEIKPKEGESFTLKELQEYVDGYIELVRFGHDLRRMMVNEDGKRLELSFNQVATHSYSGWDRLVGDVVICPESMID